MSFVDIGPPVPEKKGFYHILARRPSWTCDLDYLYIHWSPHPKDASYMALTGQVVSEEKMFEYYGDIHLIYCPGMGAYEPMGSFFSESLIFSPTAHFLQDFHIK